MEFTANADIKKALHQAHEERAKAFSLALRWIFRRRALISIRPKVSRWA